MKIASRKTYVPDGIRDDNCRGMQLSGEVSISSELKLHQVRVVTGMKVATPGHGSWSGEFADSHGDLVAGVSPGTVYTVLQHFVT